MLSTEHHLLSMHTVNASTFFMLLLLQASRRAFTPAAAFSAVSTLAGISPSSRFAHARRTFPSTETSLAVSPTSSAFTNQTANEFSTMAATEATGPDDMVYPTEMTEAERYLFDLNGFLIVRNVLTPEEVAACHAAIDARVDDAVARSDPTLRNAVEGSPMYGSGPPRLDLGGIFEWGEIESRVF
jgi:hypothetical protein